MVHLMTETQVHAKDIEEVENKEDFCNDKVLMHLTIRHIP